MQEERTREKPQDTAVAEILWRDRESTRVEGRPAVKDLFCFFSASPAEGAAIESGKRKTYRYTEEGVDMDKLASDVPAHQGGILRLQLAPRNGHEELIGEGMAEKLASGSASGLVRSDAGMLGSLSPPMYDA